MFFNTFLNMACGLQLLTQSQNNNNRPNKKNDVITDLGGEGNFPMFLSGHPHFSDFRLAYLDVTLSVLEQRYLGHSVSRWITLR